jgi:hypothetical protein
MDLRDLRREIRQWIKLAEIGFSGPIYIIFLCVYLRHTKLQCHQCCSLRTSFHDDHVSIDVNMKL